MHRCPARSVLAPVAVASAVIVACSGSPSTPTTPSAPSGPTTLSIEGLAAVAPFLLPGESVQLRAIRLAPGGAREDCTARGNWQVADPDRSPVRLDQPGVIVGRWVGTAQVSVQCDGLTGTTVVTVGRFTIDGVVRVDGTGAPVPQAFVFIQGFPASGADRADNAGRYSLEGSTAEGQLLVEAEGMEVTSMPYVWNREPRLTRDLVTRPYGERIAQGRLDVCPSDAQCPPGLERRVGVTFDVPRAGMLRIDTRTNADWPREGRSRLSCDAQDVEWNSITVGAIADFEVPASPFCEYLLEFWMPEGNYGVLGWLDYQVYLR